MFSGKRNGWIGGVCLLALLALTIFSPILLVNSQATPNGLMVKAQTLPITAQAVIGNAVINLEVARTLPEQSKGLMYRTELAPDRGMLFPFSPPQPVSFWMKNCLIPLDMIFLRQGQVIGITAHVPPCQENPCPVYPSPGPVDAVLEIGAGQAGILGVQVGDRIQIKKVSSLVSLA
ncbi:DUF192 domain-containing protein [Thermosynechococcaceae cyanobacterium BACA0444]|uniref:DUF192 domain-containing protein n=1 Tax=Pseudocalidococcus azoricus BACA0444 TaxID=2918990 RepID=A0AAE4FS92_9CYAN|nr:DUF192 domain-containing protein [Pseudocalidococcus azoricus]MDS3860664.1 DUF192 domain-containing protein [Pseudocalidococcus azoricus BACA0444]